jgi:hypothetical protein
MSSRRQIDPIRGPSIVALEFRLTLHRVGQLADPRRKLLIRNGAQGANAVCSPCQEPALARKPSVGQAGKSSPSLASRPRLVTIGAVQTGDIALRLT